MRTLLNRSVHGERRPQFSCVNFSAGPPNCFLCLRRNNWAKNSFLEASEELIVFGLALKRFELFYLHPNSRMEHIERKIDSKFYYFFQHFHSWRGKTFGLPAKSFNAVAENAFYLSSRTFWMKQVFEEFLPFHHFLTSRRKFLEGWQKNATALLKLLSKVQKKVFM